VHYRNNAPCIKKEWWYHSPSGTWFIAERNTLSDEVLATYLYGKAHVAAKTTKPRAKKEQSA
jgi:sarcosine oxidase subunit delta